MILSSSSQERDTTTESETFVWQPWWSAHHSATGGAMPELADIRRPDPRFRVNRL
jgi:hypothetical protein